MTANVGRQTAPSGVVILEAENNMFCFLELLVLKPYKVLPEKLEVAFWHPTTVNINIAEEFNLLGCKIIM
jgi:hypothetical protein